MHGDIIILNLCTTNDDHVMYGSWNIKHNRQDFLSFLAIFCPFTPPPPPPPPLKTHKIKILKNWKKNFWRYYHFKHKYHQSKSYDVWFLRYRARQTEFFLILGHFLPFYTPSSPPNNPETQNFEKMKKTPGDIIILHKCTKNHDHRLYCSWDMACDGCNCYFSFWAILFPFTPLTTHKTRISKKWKTSLEISF